MATSSPPTSRPASPTPSAASSSSSSSTASSASSSTTSSAPPPPPPPSRTKSCWNRGRRGKDGRPKYVAGRRRVPRELLVVDVALAEQDSSDDSDADDTSGAHTFTLVVRCPSDVLTAKRRIASELRQRRGMARAPSPDSLVAVCAGTALSDDDEVPADVYAGAAADGAYQHAMHVVLKGDPVRSAAGIFPTPPPPHPAHPPPSP